MRRLFLVLLICSCLFVPALASAQQSSMSIDNILKESTIVYEDNDWVYTVVAGEGFERTSKVDNHKEIIDHEIANTVATYMMGKSVIKCGDNFYYTSGEYIKKRSLNGQEIKNLVKVKTGFLIYNENRLFFNNQNDQSNIYSLNLKTMKLQKITTFRQNYGMEVLGVAKGHIFYAGYDSKHTSRYIYYGRVNGKDFRKLSSVPILGAYSSFYYQPGSSWVYFSDSQGIKKLNLTNKKTYKVRGIAKTAQATQYCIVQVDQNWVYYLDYQWRLEIPEGSAKGFEVMDIVLSKASLDGMGSVQLGVK